MIGEGTTVLAAPGGFTEGERMKKLRIPRIGVDDAAPLEKVDERLSLEGTAFTLDEVAWPAHPYRPEVKVTIGHAGSAICLRFAVREQAVLAEKSETNSQVSEDSCVELFIAPADDGLYYNFEWNCIGTCLAGVGTERHGRELLPPEVIARIRRSSTLGARPFAERREEGSWSLVALLPISVFIRHKLSHFDGLEAAGNFYKCGDHLTVPHYVTWNRIETPAPDYHRPEYFGRLSFG